MKKVKVVNYPVRSYTDKEIMEFIELDGKEIKNLTKMLRIKFSLLDKNAKLPSYAHTGDAGFDIYSSEEKAINKGKYELISTGISSEIPKGYFVSLRDRSGLAAKNGLHVFAGVIDAGYRGEWKVVLANFGNKPYKVGKKERIAQGILQFAPRTKIVQAKKLSKSKRGIGGFGSTGKK